MDSLMVVKVQNNPPIYYEYQRRPCVELSFYDNPTKISNTWDLSMCANPKVDAAHDACCSNPDDYDAWGELLCRYDFERTTLSTARSRCQSAFPNGDVCDFKYTGIGDECFTPETKMEGIVSHFNVISIIHWSCPDIIVVGCFCCYSKMNGTGLVKIVHCGPKSMKKAKLLLFTTLIFKQTTLLLGITTELICVSIPTIPTTST
jgi:hypothetical protein